MPSFFDIVNDLSFTKERLIDKDQSNLSHVNQFMINRAFSQGLDTIMYANEMNKCPDIDKEMLYEFYFHSLRKQKRFNKWAKGQNPEDFDAITEYFGFSHEKTMEALRCLSKDQITEIKSRLDKGGFK